MKLDQRLCQVIDNTEELRRDVERIKLEAEGFDLLRHLKAAEAELMDVLHNLNQARKLMNEPG